MCTLLLNSLLLSKNKLNTMRSFRFLVLRPFSSQNCDDPVINTTQKILKVAIIGTPNVGKSTLLNQIIGRNVFAFSCKVHTTRSCARAVKVIGDTQLIFLDTPGLVTIKESKKHHLERSFLVDSEEAVAEADVIGVLHDAANKYTKFFLDPKIQRILYMHQRKHTFLILNKVDAVKSKSDLLDCVRILTEQDNKKMLATGAWPNESRITETNLEFDENRTGWPFFRDVFMVSALTGDGIGDIETYLLKLAKPGEWLFPKATITDQEENKIVENTVFSKLLDHLPNVVPYNLKVETEYLNFTPEGAVSVIARITTKNSRTVKLVIGPDGQRIRKIAQDVEQCLRKFYLKDVMVRLIVEEGRINLDKK